MTDLFSAFQNYIWLTFLIVAMIILTSIERFRSALIYLWQLALQLFRFIGDALTESTGKTSYSRLAGSYVLYKITTAPGPIPDEWMTLFMVLIGYQLISGLLKENPAIVELIRAKYAAPAKKDEAAS